MTFILYSIDFHKLFWDPDNIPKILMSFIVLFNKTLINQLFFLHEKYSDLSFSYELCFI